MMRPTDKELLLRLVPENGTKIGNKTARTKLGWNADKYFRVRNALVLDGKLVIGPGKGGSIGMAEDIVETSSFASTKAEKNERAWYQHVLDGLNTHWALELCPHFSDFVGTITAHQGRKETGGKWSRPDLAFYGYGAFRFCPGRVFDLVTFEVKLASACQVDSVYETVAHKRWATRAWLIIVGDLTGKDFSQIRDEAEKQNIGILLASEHDPDTWEVLVQARHTGFQPTEVDWFVGAYFDDEHKNRIEAWCR